MAKKTPPTHAPADSRATAIWVPIESVKLDPRNARERTPRNLQAIRKSLDRFGQRKPLVVDADGFVCAGNGTLLAARELGWSEVWIAPTHLRGAEARAFAIADNRAGDLSQFDEAELTLQIGELPADLLEVTGFDAAELDELLPKAAPVGPDGQPIPKQQDSRKKIGAAIRARFTVRVLLSMSTVETFERAMTATGSQNREHALTEICRVYLESKGQLDLS